MGGILPCRCLNSSPMRPHPDTQPSFPLPSKGSGQSHAGRRVRHLHRSLCLQHRPHGPKMLLLPFGHGASCAPRALAWEHLGSPSTANSALQDKPLHQLIAGPAAADRQSFSDLAGPNKQLFFPTPSHQSQLTASPPWSRVCFSP